MLHKNDISNFIKENILVNIDKIKLYIPYFIMVVTITLIFIDLNNIFLTNYPLNYQFWTAYIGIIVALIPITLVLIERKENEEQVKQETEVKEIKLKKENEEKEAKTIFFNGISRVRPKIVISYDNIKGQIILNNLGIGNATNIEIYCNYIANSEYVYRISFVEIQGYNLSNFTLRPNKVKSIENLKVATTSSKNDGYMNVNAASVKKLLIIYTNLLGSEICISEFMLNDD